MRSKTFARWLLEQRLARSWSRADLASYVQVDASLVYRWETGEVYPRLAQFARLMHVLCVEPRKLKAVLRMVQDLERDVAA